MLTKTALLPQKSSYRNFFFKIFFEFALFYHENNGVVCERERANENWKQKREIQISEINSAVNNSNEHNIILDCCCQNKSERTKEQNEAWKYLNES